MLIVLWALLFLQSSVSTQEEAKPLPELGPFLQSVRAHLRSDRLLLSQYTYTEKETEREFDKKGNLKSTDVNEYEVYPSFEEGLSYQRHISKNGKPISEKDLAKQDREHDKKLAEHEQKSQREGVDEKARRLAKEAEARRKEDEVINELFQLYQVSIAGRASLEGCSAILLTFQPRPDYRPKTKEARILMKFAGKAWIGEKDYELIRVEVELIDNLSFGFGVLARLNKGATAVFQRRRVNDEIWLPAEARFKGTGRLLLLKGLRIEDVSEFSEYKKFTVATTVSFSNQKNP